jgi:topoisomerase-4 subunit A
VESDNTPMLFIAEGKNSYLVDLSSDLHPQIVVTFGGKYAHREPETIDAEEYIAKKGIAAKGKKCHQYDLKKVAFGEPLHKPEDDAPSDVPESTAAPEEVEEAIDILDVPEIEITDHAGKAGDILRREQEKVDEAGDSDIIDFEPTLF